jgi:hypothetical protein
MEGTGLGSYSWFYILFGIALLGLFIVMFRSSQKTLERSTAPRRTFAYECVVTPLSKANAELRARFPQLESLEPTDELQLIRFGLLNWGTLPLEPAQIEQPIALQFDDATEVLTVELGETLQTDAILPEPPRIDGSRVVFPRFAIARRGTVIFNLIVRGDGTPTSIAGTIEGVGPVRRLS